MISFYRIEHPSDRSLYFKNDSSFLKKSGLESHEYSNDHKGIFEIVEKMYYKDINDLTIELGSLYGSQYAIDHFYSVIYSYFLKQTFRCFFNNIKCIKEWFTQAQLKDIKDEGYILYKYDFEVDFDPLKIYICDVQTAIDIEYMERDSTIKTPVKWDNVYSVSEHFREYLNKMSDAEIYYRLSKAEQSGMDRVIDEWVDPEIAHNNVTNAIPYENYIQFQCECSKRFAVVANDILGNKDE